MTAADRERLTDIARTADVSFGVVAGEVRWLLEQIERLERVLAAERMESAPGWTVGGRTQWIYEEPTYPNSAEVTRSEHGPEWNWWVGTRTGAGYLQRTSSGRCSSAIEAMDAAVAAEAALAGSDS